MVMSHNVKSSPQAAATSVADWLAGSRIDHESKLCMLPQNILAPSLNVHERTRWPSFRTFSHKLHLQEEKGRDGNEDGQTRPVHLGCNNLSQRTSLETPPVIQTPDSVICSSTRSRTLWSTEGLVVVECLRHCGLCYLWRVFSSVRQFVNRTFGLVIDRQRSSNMYSVPTTASPNLFPVDGVVHWNIGSDFFVHLFVSLLVNKIL